MEISSNFIGVFFQMISWLTEDRSTFLEISGNFKKFQKRSHHLALTFGFGKFTDFLRMVCEPKHSTVSYQEDIFRT